MRKSLSLLLLETKKVPQYFCLVLLLFVVVCLFGLGWVGFYCFVLFSWSSLIQYCRRHYFRLKKYLTCLLTEVHILCIIVYNFKKRICKKKKKNQTRLSLVNKHDSTQTWRRNMIYTSWKCLPHYFHAFTS